MKFSILFIFCLCILFSGCKDDDIPMDEPIGFKLVGNYSNDNSPSFTIDTRDTEIKVLEDIICTSLGNKVEILIKDLSVVDDNTYEVSGVTVREKRNGKWVEDSDFTESIEDVTDASVVIALQSSVSGTDADATHYQIKTYANKLMETFLLSKVGFRVAIVEYRDTAFPLQTFSTDVLNDSINNTLLNTISIIENQPNEAEDLFGVLNLSVELLTSQNADYKAIFIIGEGKNNAGNGSLEDAIINLQANNITDVYCIGAAIENQSLPADGVDNFMRLSNEGNGYFRTTYTPSHVLEVYDSCYKYMPNLYNLGYIRTLAASESVELQWNLAVEKKK